MERESFIFYKSFYEAITDLPKDIRLEVLTAIIEYALYGREPQSLKPFARGMFTLVRPNLDANTARYINGTKGGRKSKKSAANPVADYSLSYPQEVQAMKDDNDFAQSVCNDFNISIDEYISRLAKFLDHCLDDPKNIGKSGHDSDTDAKTHLRYWMAKAFPIDKQTKKSTPKSKMKTTDTIAEARQRQIEWEQQRRNAAHPDDYIRSLGYDPSSVTIAQVMNPQWRHANPPSINPQKINSDKNKK